VLAKIEGRGTDGTPIVLFLCVHNAGRSQIALGWFNHLAAGRAVAWSGGSEPGSEINPSAVAAMAEIASTSPPSARSATRSAGASKRCSPRSK
jgi:protein-tyrosine-phosphatase